MLGSFVIGLAAASTVAGLANKKAMAVLPGDHPWQHNFPLQIGVRTGYCGTVTTFSAWINELVGGAILRNTWMNAVLGLAVGMAAAVASYSVGVHMALFIDRWLLKDSEDVLLEEEEYRAAELETFRQATAARGAGVQRLPSVAMQAQAAAAAGQSKEQDELEQVERELPRLTTLRHRHSAVGAAFNGAIAEDNAENGTAAAPDSPPAASAPAPDAAAPVPTTKTDAFILLALVIATAGACVGVALETNHSWLCQAWIAVLFAPLGCWLRWVLSRANYSLKGRFDWAPAGTFAANMLGTTVSGGLSAIALRADPGPTGLNVIAGASLGFCGALSTVSTFVTEVVKFADVFPDVLYAYTYALATIVGGALVIITVFGWAVWAY
jgi:CrcB protein